MKRHILFKIICLLTALVLTMLFVGCSKKDEEEDRGVVLERNFNTEPVIAEPEPTVEQTPEPEEPEPPSASIVLAEGAESIAYINADEVNVREINSTSGNVLGKLAAGSIISVINEDYGNGWSQIDYNGASAFMASQYITNITSEKTIPIECRATVNASDVNMRAASTTDALSIGKLNNGTEVEVIKKDAGHSWSMILFDSKIAFVSSRYLTFSEA